MMRRSGIRYLVSLGLVVVLNMNPLAERRMAAQDRNDKEPGSSHRDDVCDQLPNPPGLAKGIDKKCPPAGSSSGIAKGDFNGDGLADLAIGVPDEDVGSVDNAGAVNVIYGSQTGLTAGATGVPSAQFWSLDSSGVPGDPETGDRFGAALAAGDFNGDGFSDLAIGIPNKSATTSDAFGIQTVHKGAGAVVVIYGSTAGLSASVPRLAPQFLDMRITDPTCGNPTGCFFALDNAHFGQALAWGNFNGDKFSGVIDVADLAIGIPGTSNVDIFLGGPQTPGEGAVFVIHGNPDGGLIRGSVTTIEEAFAIVDFAEDDLFGAALTAGDFDGDGFSDLAVGAPGHAVNGNDDAGRVIILRGASGGIRNTAFQNWSQNSSGITCCVAERGDEFGIALAAGDFNGDGRSDLVIGVPFEDNGSLNDAGIAHVLFGSGSGLTATGTQTWSLAGLGDTDEAGAQFGRALAAGDFNGDGRTDLAIGAPRRDVGGVVDAGQVNVIYGGPTGLSLTRAPQTWTQRSPGITGLTPERGDQFGRVSQPGISDATSKGESRAHPPRISPLVFRSKMSTVLRTPAPCSFYMDALHATHSRQHPIKSGARRLPEFPAVRKHLIISALHYIEASRRHCC